MNRGRREKSIIDDDVGAKIIKYITIGVGILAVIVIGLLIYSKSLNDRVKSESLSSEQITNLVNEIASNESTESASSEIGRSVNEVANEMNNTNSLNSDEANNITNTSNSISTSNENTNMITGNTVTQSSVNEQTNNVDDNAPENVTTEETSAQNSEKEELSFQKPVEGDIIKDFAKDNLVYSNTLEEWTTHTGIDIKADKTTVVNSAEAGTVKSIKNDPRYGLTIVVEHTGGYETVYSNLLTSEFVIEGEKVEKGQALGTVGNTAAFEIADEPHLHFEILKDSVAIDPSIYIK